MHFEVLKFVIDSVIIKLVKPKRKSVYLNLQLFVYYEHFNKIIITLHNINNYRLKKHQNNVYNNKQRNLSQH